MTESLEIPCIKRYRRLVLYLFFSFSLQNWEKVLRKIIESCYHYHEHGFLLKYSRDLCENERANLRYVKATDTTTDLYSREPKKLLLTFRNENMVESEKHTPERVFI